MEIGVLDDRTYRAVQIAQTAYFLGLRDLARQDPITAACLFKITRSEAKRLANTSVLDLQNCLSYCQPILTVAGQDSFKSISPISALLDAIEDGVKSVNNTASHISAYSGPVNYNNLAHPVGVDDVEDIEDVDCDDE